PSLTAGTCLLSGGLCLLLVSHLSGETAALHSVSPRSLASLLYLVAFGSVIAFAAYTWLMRVTSPARVSTHSFVNPAVAVFAGWALAGEALGPRTLLATLAMVAGAAAIVAEGVRFYPAGLRSRACASRWTAVAIGERWTARQPPSSGH
ncbi:MAG: EamA family transporter, partial [Gemmatimonadota bacterium]